MVNTASDVKLNALSNALSFDPFAPLLSSEIALKVCPDFYCSPVRCLVASKCFFL
jgi:hypothetical protein